MRERLGYPLCQTAWTVGEQLPLLEGKPASEAWKALSFQPQAEGKEAPRG
jgi:glycyl-tRNA synthetase alpha chain